jgi:hypothetical protein
MAIPTARSGGGGAPPARHTHTLRLARQRSREQLFPRSRAGLVEAEAVPAATLTGRSGVAAPSREQLDGHITRRIQADPEARFLTEAVAVGLLAERDGPVVRGVAARHRDRARESGWSEPSDLPAYFVIAVTGRTSRPAEGPTGPGTSAESVADALMAYSTCAFAPPPGCATAWKWCSCRPLPALGVPTSVSGVGRDCSWCR